MEAVDVRVDRLHQGARRGDHVALKTGAFALVGLDDQEAGDQGRRYDAADDQSVQPEQHGPAMPAERKQCDSVMVRACVVRGATTPETESHPESPAP